MKSSFLPFRERLQLIEQVIKPRYAPLEAWAHGTAAYDRGFASGFAGLLWAAMRIPVKRLLVALLTLALLAVEHCSTS